MRLRKRYGVAAVILLVIAIGTKVGISQTQRTEFCLSCHEMRVYQKELEASPHAKDAQGNPIGCTQCHVPGSGVVRMMAAKSFMGIKDVWVHYVQPRETWDRAAMQPAARRFVDDANCLACHKDLTRNAKGDGPVSAEGKLAHDAYLGKNGQARSGCAGCHMNMAHLPPFDARLPHNAKFKSKLEEMPK